MPRLILFLLACAWAAVAPWLADARAGTMVGARAALPAPLPDRNGEGAGQGAGTLGWPAARGAGSPDWPSTWEGRPLRPLPLTASDRKFAGESPWALARFTDGERELLFRRVDRATRALHPAADCLRASGYASRPLPAWSDESGRAWSRIEARGKGETLEVREMICAEEGACWPDVSAWYWNAAWGRTRGPWTAITVSRRLPEP